MTAPLIATLEPTSDTRDVDEVAVTLRITNASDSTVEVLNPDMGRPSAQMNWPGSIEAYAASLLMSFGFLAISVSDDSDNQVDRQPLETWATPVLRPRVALSPGDSLDVPIPIGRFFRFSPGGKYRVTVEYGDDALKVTARDTVYLSGRDSRDER